MKDCRRTASARVLSALAGPDKAATESVVAALCNREVEVFRLSGQGKGAREIAGTLGLSVKTIETHCGKFRPLHAGGDTAILRQSCRVAGSAESVPIAKEEGILADALG